jgi:predicted transcriptional regulator YdeE
MLSPAFVTKEQIILAGVGFFGDPFQMSGDWTSENEIGRLWKRLLTFQAEHAEKMPTPIQPGVYYEVHIEHDVTMETGEYEIFVGLEIPQARSVPVELLVKILPPVKYAVFTLRGQEITSDWPRRISQEWFPTSGYRRAYQYGFQWYDQRFKGLENIEQSEIDVYVPIIPVE